MKIKDLKAGDMVKVDDDYCCLIPGMQTVQEDDFGNLFIWCKYARHYLDTLVGENGELVGIKWPETLGRSAYTAKDFPYASNR